MLYGAMNSPFLPVFEEMDLIAGLGFDYLELAMDPPEAHYSLLRSQKAEFRHRLAAHRIGLICHLPTFVFTADLTPRLREASMEEMLGSLEVAAELQPLKVVLHPSRIQGLGHYLIDQVDRYASRALDEITEKAEALGITLCIENMFPGTHSLLQPVDFLKIFKQYPKLKMALDIGHAHLLPPSGRKELQFIRILPDRIFHVHASDNLGQKDDHLPIGSGTVDFPSVVKALKRIGYDQTVTLEVFSRDRDYLELSRDKLAAMFEALEA